MFWRGTPLEITCKSRNHSKASAFIGNAYCNISYG